MTRPNSLYVVSETAGTIAFNESAYNVTRTTLSTHQHRNGQVYRYNEAHLTLNVSKQNMKLTRGMERTPNAFVPMSA